MMCFIILHGRELLEQLEMTCTCKTKMSAMRWMPWQRQNGLVASYSLVQEVKLNMVELKDF